MRVRMPIGWRASPTRTTAVFCEHLLERGDRRPTLTRRRARHYLETSDPAILAGAEERHQVAS